jgi:microcystin-dependent protein
MATWSFQLVRPTGEYVGALSAATARKLSFFVDAAATAAFTMPGDHPQTAQIAELSVDVAASRNGTALFRGRVGNSTDQLTADTITSTFAALDYRGMLGRRILWQGVTRSFRGADQADIAWQMIADTQALAGGALSITRGAAAATGQRRDRDYDPGKNLGEAITQLGQVQNGFEWEIDASRRFNLFYPQRGRSTGLVLTYGRDIVEAARSLDASAFANAIRFNGSNNTTADELTVTSWDPEQGRWDGQKSDPNLILQATVDQRAAYELADASTLTPAYQVTMVEGLWDPAQIWVGDTVTLVVASGRLNVNAAYRIVQIDITLSDDGAEKVVLSVQAAPAALTSRLVEYNSRIQNLERHSGYIPDVPVGGMFDWPGSTPPQLTMWCDGSSLSQAAYPELYAVIGTTFGTAGAGLFNLPDCRGRMTVAAGTGTGLTARTVGQTGGAETVALAAAQGAAHSHTMSIATSTDSVDHTHGAGSLTTGIEGTPHNHGLGWSAAGAVASGPYTGIVQATGNTNTTNEQANHGHAVNGTTAVESATHIHAVNGTTAATAAAAGHENMAPWIAIGKVIKVQSPQNQ